MQSPIRSMWVSKLLPVRQSRNDVKTGNAGPKLHWCLLEKSGSPALTLDLYFLANNNGHNGDIWV